MTSQPVFKTYKEFADSVRPPPRGVLGHPGYHPSRLRIVDISSSGNVDNWSLELTDEETRSTEKYHARLETERRALRALPKDVKTRLVLFEQREHESSFIYDLYGLEFRIEPSFFKACIGYESNLDYKRLVFLEQGPPAFLKLGKGWGAKFIDRGFNHPLLRGGMTISMGNLHFEKISCLFVSVLISLPYGSYFSKITGNYIPFNSIFVETINQWASADLVDANEQPLKFLTPMLEMSVERLQSAATSCYEKFRTERTKQDALTFEYSWRPLRDAVVDEALPLEAFKQYDSYHFNGAVQESSKLQQLIRQYDDVHARLLELEQHIRDELQLQVGYLSLLESKESINQSKIALQESKRVKMRGSTHLSSLMIKTNPANSCNVSHNSGFYFCPA